MSMLVYESNTNDYKPSSTKNFKDKKKKRTSTLASHLR